MFVSKGNICFLCDLCTKLFVVRGMRSCPKENVGFLCWFPLLVVYKIVLRNERCVDVQKQYLVSFS